MNARSSAGGWPRRALAIAAAAGLAAAGAVLAAGYGAFDAADDAGIADVPTGTGGAPQAERIARGAYLARVGNCAGCHTARGGAAYAGGRGVATPFGTVYASNITPDADTGIGAWSAAEFRRALRHGRSRDGRLLYPAFPYPSYSRVSREDADAMFVFLRAGVAPVRQENRAHELRFPYDSQLALAAWRGLFFRPARFEPDPTRPAEVNRGAYLVQGLGHCSACHAAYNRLGASRAPAALGGGLIPSLEWYAPPLAAAARDGTSDELVALLRDGVSTRGSAMGPMAEVVRDSTQHWSEADLRAAAAYLRTLPQSEALPPDRAPAAADSEPMRRGAALYERHCADCHGAAGQGVPGIYPPLAGNRAVSAQPPANTIRAVLAGGFPPSTRGNPRPYGMPPFGPELNDSDVAAVVSFVRGSWGNAGSAVEPRHVDRFRRGAPE